jgi:hypothetical protein
MLLFVVCFFLTAKGKMKKGKKMKKLHKEEKLQLHVRQRAIDNFLHRLMDMHPNECCMNF